MTNPFEHEADLLTHKEPPRNTFELQVVLMEDYYLSQHVELSPDVFLGPDKNKHEAAAMKEWNSIGLAAKYRKMIEDPEYRGNLDISLDQVMQYNPK